MSPLAGPLAGPPATPVWQTPAGSPGGPPPGGNIPADQNSLTVTNTYGMTAAITVSGPVQISVDGTTLPITSGTFILPAGHTVTVHYPAPPAPTWVWVLF